MIDYSNEFIEALIKFPKPGFNAPESKWYFKRFQAKQQQTARLHDLAKTVSDENNIPLPEAIKLIIQAEKRDVEAVSQLGPWMVELAEIQDSMTLSTIEAQLDIATMMLASRLPLAWVLEKKECLLETYGVELPDEESVNYGALQKLKAKDRLQSEKLWEVMSSIAEMLTGEIPELAEYALNEYRNGKPQEKLEPETPEEELGKLESELEKPNGGNDS
ncbi:MAG: hypothetical protein AAF959_15225 [Cyanobacteria bacterium P01_D01_bin.56]